MGLSLIWKALHRVGAGSWGTIYIIVHPYIHSSWLGLSSWLLPCLTWWGAKGGLFSVNSPRLENSLAPEFWLNSGYQVIHEMPKLRLYIGFKQVSQVNHTDSHRSQNHLDIKAKDGHSSSHKETNMLFKAWATSTETFHQSQQFLKWGNKQQTLIK